MLYLRRKLNKTDAGSDERRREAAVLSACVMWSESTAGCYGLFNCKRNWA